MGLTVDWKYNGITEQRVMGRVSAKSLKHIFQMEDEIPVTIIRGSEKYSGILVDISAGGILVNVAGDFEINDWVTISLVLSGHSIRSRGKVRHRNYLPDINRYGIVFRNLDDESIDIIKGLYVTKSLMYKRTP